MVGDRIISTEYLAYDHEDQMCDKNSSHRLYNLYCSDINATDSCDYFMNDETVVDWIKGIPGFAGGVASGKTTYKNKHLLAHLH